MSFWLLIRTPSDFRKIRDMAGQAVVADATDRKAIEILGVEQMDAVMVCIDSGLSDSILATLNLKEIEVERVLVRARKEAHGRLLFKIGASEVFFPEKDMALSVAERLHNPNMLDYLPFIEDYSIIELAPSKGFIGKTLRDLDPINRYGVQVIAIKETLPDRLNLIPTGQFVLKDSDIIILLGPNAALDKLREEEAWLEWTNERRHPFKPELISRKGGTHHVSQRLDEQKCYYRRCK